MKCDELQQVENPIEWGLYYDKPEVDAAIAELKAENERLNNALDKERSETIKYMDELCNAKNEIERLTIDKRNAELRADVADATIAKLNAKLESVQASTYVDSVDAGMRERRLKRDLWLMTAEWAEGMGLASCNIAIKLSFKERFFYHDEANREKDIKKYKHRQVVFYKYADYCRAKAEENK